jgi:S-(hydroxymethyl)glutathione dehydrogenase/alcohol dehydrogenase
MAATGVCHSDWHLVTGATRHPLPVVPGHEGAGYVESVGPGVAEDLVGSLVALNWAPSCGECFFCLRGRPALCQVYSGPLWKGTMLDGETRLHAGGDRLFHFSGLAGFAEYAVVPRVCCVPLAAGIPPEVAALIGCAVTTGVGSVVNTAKVVAGASVVVFGAGGVGLSTVLGARMVGASPVTAVDVSERKLEMAKRCGADHAFLNGPRLVTEIKEVTGYGADYVFEAIGNPQVQALAIDCARPGGTVVFSGIAPSDATVPLNTAQVTRKELTLLGSYYGTSNPAFDFRRIADLYATGRLPLGELVTRRYPLEEINEAYADMLAGRVARGLVEF